MSVELYPPYNSLDPDVVAAGARYLELLGVDLDTKRTYMMPYRLTYYLQYLMAGEQPYHCTTFPNENPVITHVVVVPKITFWSACSHHCLPFFGEISIGYMPDKLLIGLSKISLIVRSIAHGYWMQEHLANAIADRLEDVLQPQGIAVCTKAQHTCQLLDLKQPPIPKMIITILRGALEHNTKAQDEFYTLMESGDV